MRTLHVIDPALRGGGGHYLSQHTALWHLCRQHGYAMHSYCHSAFDAAAMPAGIAVTALFGDTRPADTIGHYATDAAQANLQCHDGLAGLTADRFAADDLILLTTVTVRTAMGFGRWLQDVAGRLTCPVGIYCTLSAELEDTVGRSLRRDRIAIGDDSFGLLDEIVVPNEFKRSVYRYLFSSIPRDRHGSYAVFYEEPFPSRGFLDAFDADRIRFHSLRSMYQGGDAAAAPPPAPVPAGGRKTVAFVGSGGVAAGEKGWHRIVSIVERVLAQRDDVRFAIHAGGNPGDAVEEALQALKRQDAGGDRIAVSFGALDSAAYCALLEAADLVCLPYGARYKHIMSGVFDDCTFLGKVAVVPANSKMARWMHFHNLATPGFAEADPQGIAAALIEALERFPVYDKAFRQAREIARTAFRLNNPVAVLSGLTAAPANPAG